MIFNRQNEDKMTVDLWKGKSLPQLKHSLDINLYFYIMAFVKRSRSK